MKFELQDQYPEKWINGNLPEKPLGICFLEKDKYKFDSWYLNIDSLENLINIGKLKQSNLFINITDNIIIFTKQTEPE